MTKFSKITLSVVFIIFAVFFLKWAFGAWDNYLSFKNSINLSDDFLLIAQTKLDATGKYHLSNWNSQLVYAQKLDLNLIRLPYNDLFNYTLDKKDGVLENTWDRGIDIILAFDNQTKQEIEQVIKKLSGNIGYYQFSADLTRQENLKLLNDQLNQVRKSDPKSKIIISIARKDLLNLNLLKDFDYDFIDYNYTVDDKTEFAKLRDQLLTTSKKIILSYNLNSQNIDDTARFKATFDAVTANKQLFYAFAVNNLIDYKQGQEVIESGMVAIEKTPSGTYIPSKEREIFTIFGAKK